MKLKSKITFLILFLIFVFFVSVKAAFNIIPPGTPDFIIPKLKNYNYYLSSIPAGKYTLIVIYSNQELYKTSEILKNKKMEIGIFPDLRYISSNSVNMYKLFSTIPEKGKTKIFESQFITDTNPLTFSPLPFSFYFSLSTNEDSVIYNSNIDHKYISIFKHKEKDEYLVFFDINFDGNFSDLIILINYISPCSSSGGGRGGGKGNTPF